MTPHVVSLHHVVTGPCPLCEAKLATAHPYLVSWFRRVRKKYLNAHVSWAYRSADEQNECYRKGQSELQYPASAHNKTKADGTPCSHALDLFQLDEDGVARFPPLWYAKVDEDNRADREPLLWGKAFKSLGDLCHWQLNPPAEPPVVHEPSAAQADTEPYWDSLHR